MHDTIYRQQAIEALDKHIDTFDAIDTNYLCGLRTAMSILKEIPSAQPETHDKRTETHECDLINRQQAIDEVKRLHDVAWANWKETRISANTMIDALKDLPSAQPERPEQPESAKEYCAECNHIEMCRWYPYEGCEFRSLPSAQPETHDKRTETHACDLINRQQAIDAVDVKCLHRGIVKGLQAIIEDLPSAQPERKSARWEILYPNHTYKYHCSECGANYKYMFDFCPSCGARMDGEANV